MASAESNKGVFGWARWLVVLFVWVAGFVAQVSNLTFYPELAIYEDGLTYRAALVDDSVCLDAGATKSPLLDEDNCFEHYFDGELCTFGFESELTTEEKLNPCANGELEFGIQRPETTGGSLARLDGPIVMVKNDILFFRCDYDITPTPTSENKGAGTRKCEAYIQQGRRDAVKNVVPLFIYGILVNEVVGVLAFIVSLGSWQSPFSFNSTFSKLAVLIYSIKDVVFAKSLWAAVTFFGANSFLAKRVMSVDSYLPIRFLAKAIALIQAIAAVALPASIIALTENESKNFEVFFPEDKEFEPLYFLVVINVIVVLSNVFGILKTLTIECPCCKRSAADEDEEEAFDKRADDSDSELEGDEDEEQLNPINVEAQEPKAEASVSSQAAAEEPLKGEEQA